MIDNFNLFIKHANALIFAVDLDLRVSEWNLKCEEVTHLERSDVLGMPVEKIVPDLFRAQIKEVMTSALNRTETSRFRMPVYTKNGELATLLMSATTQFSDSVLEGEGEQLVAGAIFVGSDESEEALTTQTAATKSANTRQALAPIRELQGAGVSLFDTRPLHPLHITPSIVPRGNGDFGLLGSPGMVLPAALPVWGSSERSRSRAESRGNSRESRGSREGWEAERREEP